MRSTTTWTCTSFFFFNDTATTEIYTLSLHDALPILPDDADELPHPIIGYYGVIDERMDLDAIRLMAEREPSWQLLLIGPVTKIDPEALPQAPNIHYTG